MAKLLMGRTVVNDETCRETMRSYVGNPEIDQDLCRLISRCLAIIPNNRPRLAVLLARVFHFFRTRTAAFYAGFPNARRETDDHIRQILNQYVLSGNT